MEKKQLRALIDIAGKDKLRPALQAIKIDTFKDKTVAVATNGYVMAVVNLDDSFTELVGTVIETRVISNWLKTSAPREVFSGETAKDAMKQFKNEYTVDYPDWKRVVRLSITNRQEPIKSYCVNAEALNKAQKALDATFISIERMDDVYLKVKGGQTDMLENGFCLVGQIKQGKKGL